MCFASLLNRVSKKVIYVYKKSAPIGAIDAWTVLIDVRTRKVLICKCRFAPLESQNDFRNNFLRHLKKKTLIDRNISVHTSQ